jgi:hypothetical protein
MLKIFFIEKGQLDQRTPESLATKQMIESLNSAETVQNTPGNQRTQKKA